MCSDRGWAWAVAFAALVLNFVVAGLGRTSGLLFVSFIEEFRVDRRGAAAPFAVRSSVSNLMGPVVGIVAQKYGVQKVIVAGSVIATLSAALCFFARDIFWITFLWGGLGGAGAVLTLCVVQVRLGQYFEKHRTSAAGMGYSGGCLGSFIFPALLEWMLGEYGMQETFLLVAGGVMHCLPAAMVLRKPPWMKAKKEIANSTNELVTIEDGAVIPIINDLNGNSKQHDSIKDLGDSPDVQILQEYDKLVIKLLTIKLPIENTTAVCQEKVPNGIHPEIETCIQETMECLYYEQRHCNQKNQFDQNSELSKKNTFHDTLKKSNIKYICRQKSRSFHLGKQPRLGILPKTSSVPNITKKTNNISANYALLRMREVFEMEITQVMSQCPDCSTDEVLKVLAELKKLYRKHVNAGNGSYLATAYWDVPIKQAANSTEQNYTNSTKQKNKNSIELEDNSSSNEQKNTNTLCFHLKTAIRLFANPLFVLTCLCRTVHNLTSVPIITTIVDMAIDKGLKEEDGKYVIAALSLGDLIGRLCFGWVTDKGFMSLPKFMLLVMVVQGANSVTLPLMKTELVLYLSLGLCGLLQGSLLIRHSVLVFKYLERHEHSIAMGSINLFSGFLGFVLPMYIGYFRDTLGTYDYIFYVNGGLCAAIGLLWTFEPYFIQWHSSRTAKNDQPATQD